MTTDEFLQRAVGIPWRRFAADWSACDCLGLVDLYCREVLGFRLGASHDSYVAGLTPWVDIASACGWQQSTAAEATCLMTWRGGEPRHCGVMLPGGKVLHAEGSEDRPRSVRISRLAAISNIYGQVRFYRPPGG